MDYSVNLSAGLTKFCNALWNVLTVSAIFYCGFRLVEIINGSKVFNPLEDLLCVVGVILLEFRLLTWTVNFIYKWFKIKGTIVFHKIFLQGNYALAVVMERPTGRLSNEAFHHFQWTRPESDRDFAIMVLCRLEEHQDYVPKKPKYVWRSLINFSETEIPTTSILTKFRRRAFKEKIIIENPVLDTKHTSYFYFDPDFIESRIKWISDMASGKWSLWFKLQTNYQKEREIWPVFSFEKASDAIAFKLRWTN